MKSRRRRRKRKKKKENTPGTKGWSRLRDRTLAVQKKHAKITFFSSKNKNYLFFLDIPSSYAKILGETNFQSREFPKGGEKQKA